MQITILAPSRAVVWQVFDPLRAPRPRESRYTPRTKGAAGCAPGYRTFDSSRGDMSNWELQREVIATVGRAQRELSRVLNCVQVGEDFDYAVFAALEEVDNILSTYGMQFHSE